MRLVAQSARDRNLGERLAGCPHHRACKLDASLLLACVDAGTGIAQIRLAYPFVTDEHITAARAYRGSLIFASKSDGRNTAYFPMFFDTPSVTR
jgi:hypothetical protein